MPEPGCDRLRRTFPFLLVLLGIAVYHNSLSGPFIFDDSRHLLEKDFQNEIWPIWKAFAPWSPRSFVTFTFSVNHAIGGERVYGYHLLNLLIHLLAGLALFGILRRTLQLHKCADRYRQHADGIAFAVSAIWIVHPLQTQSVTYIIQRAESLMGLCYLATFYFAIRGMIDHRARWQVLSVVMCTLGMMSKQVMVTAPILILIYDRIFMAESFQDIFRKRRGLYFGYLLPWALLCTLMILGSDRSVLVTAGFQMDRITPWQYAVTQPAVIVHYLKLSIWPHPLVLDYDWLLTQNIREAFFPAAILLILLAGTLRLTVKKEPFGFAGVWFFLILAPTSSVMPIADAAFEHRMYLPLAAVILVCVAAAFECIRGKGLRNVLMLAVIFSYGFLTVQRNNDYASSLSIWKDTVEKRPLNPRAHNNFGKFLLLNGQPQEAIKHFQTALKLYPNLAVVHNNLGITWAEEKNHSKAIQSFSRALEIHPDFADAHYNLGVALNEQGKSGEAALHLMKSIELGHQVGASYNNLGIALMKQGRVNEAVESFRQALDKEPKLADSYNNLGIAMMQSGQLGEAYQYYQAGLELDPENSELQNNLGILRIKEGKREEAIPHFLEAARLDPDYLDVHRNLGTLYAGQGRMDEALKYYKKVLAIDPKNAKTHANVGAIYLTQARFDQAAEHLQRALQLDPNHVQAKQNLANLKTAKDQNEPAKTP